MTQEIQWGPAIAVDGKRPGFVRDEDRFRWLGNGVTPEWYDQRCSPNDCTTGKMFNSAAWPDVTSIVLPADHPHYRQTEEAPIDWSGELEAVHEDGTVSTISPCTVAECKDIHYGGIAGYGHRDVHQGGWRKDGSPMGTHNRWRIRNVPQPTPQADTKPDLTARAPCMTISEVREMVAKGEDAVIATMLERGYALPEPVDPLHVEARMIAQRHGIVEQNERAPVYLAIEEALRGRALTLAGEKEA